MRLVVGKKQKSPIESIWNLIKNLNQKNKSHCFEMIMDLDVEERKVFFSPFMIAVSRLAAVSDGEC